MFLKREKPKMDDLKEKKISAKGKILQYFNILNGHMSINVSFSSSIQLFFFHKILSIFFGRLSIYLWCSTW